MTDTRCSDEGTTAVEFAIIGLILMTLALGAIDFGMWVFQKSEAAQAAREASRVAMIDPPTTFGVQTSGAIYDAAKAELDASVTPVVSVSCSNTCQPGVDTITVTVGWDRSALTFVGTFDHVTGESSRTVVGTP
jgi:Flp pilus assembly protein TadG